MRRQETAKEQANEPDEGELEDKRAAKNGLTQKKARVSGDSDQGFKIPAAKGKGQENKAVVWPRNIL